MLSRTIAVCAALLLTWNLSAADELQKVVIALKPDKNPDAMLKEKEALQKFLGEKIGKPVEVIIPLSTAVILEGFANGTVDLGYLSSTDLARAQQQKKADLLLAGEIDGKTTYTSYWLCLKDKPYTSIKDLKGKPIAFASKTSTSGFTVPLWDLMKQGLVKEGGKPEEFFGEGNVFFGTGYVSGIERVFSGDAEAAAVSDYVLNKDKHLTPEQKAKLKKLDEQGPVPTHVIAVRTSLPEGARATIKKALLAMNDESNQALRDKVFTSKLVEVDTTAHLSPIVEALQMTGQLK